MLVVTYLSMSSIVRTDLIPPEGDSNWGLCLSKGVFHVDWGTWKRVLTNWKDFPSNTGFYTTFHGVLQKLSVIREPAMGITTYIHKAHWRSLGPCLESLHTSLPLPDRTLTALLTMSKPSQYLFSPEQFKGGKIIYWGSSNIFLTEQYQNRSVFNICLWISLIIQRHPEDSVNHWDLTGKYPVCFLGSRRGTK